MHLGELLVALQLARYPPLFAPFIDRDLPIVLPSQKSSEQRNQGKARDERGGQLEPPGLSDRLALPDIVGRDAEHACHHLCQRQVLSVTSLSHIGRNDVGRSVG